MQCDCITEATKNMTELMQKQLGSSAKAECKSLGMIVTKDLGIQDAMFIPFEITADKPGYRKGKQMNMTANFCPICGTRINPESAPATPA